MIDTDSALATRSRPVRAMSACVDGIFVHCSASDSPEHDNNDVMRRQHVDDNGRDDVGGTDCGRTESSVPARGPCSRTGLASAVALLPVYRPAAERANTR